MTKRGYIPSANLVLPPEPIPEGSKVFVGGKPVHIISKRWDMLFDTIVIGHPTTDVDLTRIKANFFVNVSQKPRYMTNLSTDNKVPGNTTWRIYGIGIIPRQHVGNIRSKDEDIKKILESLRFVFKKNQDEIVNTLAYDLPAGRGFYGSTTETDDYNISIGVPAKSSLQFWEQPLIITDKDNIYGSAEGSEGKFFNHIGDELTIDKPVLTAGRYVALTVVLYGIREIPGVRE